MMGRRSLRDTERHGRSGDSCGGGGVGGLHGEPVSELLDTSEEPALDGGAVEERAGDVEDSSCVLAAAVQSNEVSKRRGRNGDSCGGGGASGLHGECVLELLDALEEPASDGGAVEEERAGDGEDASRVSVAEVLLDVRHGVAVR